MINQISVITTALFWGLGAASTWDYLEHGPINWGREFKDCDGKKQSPINVRTDLAQTDPNLGMVDRSMFSKLPTFMDIADNGHTLVVGDFKGTYEINDPSLLPFTAVLEQYHFHWAENAFATGSEHLLDGRRFFGEMHAVHFNKKYGSVAAAADKPDGLAVFAWFIDTNNLHTNPAFENLLHHALNGARDADDQVRIEPTFSLASLLPENLEVYYRYAGSLTTPPCYESVTWTVFKEPIQIHIRQAAILTTKFYENKEGTILLRHNYRPVQKLNGRTITKPPTSHK
ncbi:carbonic anhydrase 2-like [Styela clava]